MRKTCAILELFHSYRCMIQSFVERYKHYFSWQFKLFSRSIRQFGLPPAVGYVFWASVVIVLPALLWPQKAYFPWIYAAVGLLATNPLHSNGRIEFLKTCYSKRDFLFLHTTENLMFVLPFCFVLLIHKQFLLALGLLVITILVAYAACLNRKKLNLPALPTPFSKRLFEFALGFRVSFPLVLFLYYVILMAIVHDNFNLGIVAVYVIVITCMGYYTTMEPDYYVWLHNDNPKRFLFQKLKTAILYAFALVVVPIVALSVFFSEFIWILLLTILIGFLNLAITILLKYKEFPKPFHIGDGLLLAACVICPLYPPLVLLPIPLTFHLFGKAKQNLNNYL